MSLYIVFSWKARLQIATLRKLSVKTFAKSSKEISNETELIPFIFLIERKTMRNDWHLLTSN